MRYARLPDGLDSVVVDQIDGRDVTREELARAFDRIKNPTDWKAPIDSYVPVADVEVVRRAVMFFTATEAEVGPVEVYRDFSGGINVRRVRSVGYRAGPAGP